MFRRKEEEENCSRGCRGLEFLLSGRSTLNIGENLCTSNIARLRSDTPSVIVDERYL